MARNSTLLKGLSNNPVSNTLKLRKKYGEFKINQASEGKKAVSFHEWAEKNHPNVSILK